MLRSNLIAFLCLIAIVPFITSATRTSESAVNVRRITQTPEETLSLNPSLSGDGRHIVFESTGDIAHAGTAHGFHAIQASVATSSTTFSEIAQTRIVAPAISHDGSTIAFSSGEDLTGQNNDRNPEVFFRTANSFRQITNTSPGSAATRTTDGSFQPSITSDGRLVAFSSNRDLVGRNSDLNFEVFLFDSVTGTTSQLTDSSGIMGSTQAKISGNGLYLTFIRDNAPLPGDSRSLVFYNRETRREQNIVENAPALALTSGRAISNDGLRVVYSYETAVHQSQVFVFEASSNSSRQIMALGTRTSEVSLNPTISGDGKRVAFATRRRVTIASDGSVELYLLDIPSDEVLQLTDAPAGSTAEVVSSLNDDGSLIAFNFARLISGSVSSAELGNNSEIYLATIPARPSSGSLTVTNVALVGTDSAVVAAVPRGGIVSGKGRALAHATLHASRSADGNFPVSLGGSIVTVNGLVAQILFVSSAEVHFVIPNQTATGPAEIVVTNSDGFQSRSTVVIADVSPGVFAENGTRPRGIILNADTFVSEPFDPTGGALRLTVLATGVRNASGVSVRIAGQPTVVESVKSSPDLPGLDEIHIIVPAELRGSGEVELTVEADTRLSNPVTLALGGSASRDVVINELLADPPDGIAGDANHDGTRSAADDEFIELINSTDRDLDLTGYELASRALTSNVDILRHRFSNRTILPAGTALVIFGGGTPNASNPAFGAAKVLKASTGSLSLANGGAAVMLRDTSGSIATFVTYGGPFGIRGDLNQSLTRSPDVTGPLTLHTTVPESAQRPFSPGTRANGAQLLPFPPIAAVAIEPRFVNLLLSQQQAFVAHAIDDLGNPMQDVLFEWESNNTSVATIDGSGTATSVRAGTALITASARRVRSTPSTLVVVAPSPSPSPTPSPSPSPTISPIPSPSPSPTVSPLPSPSPSPTSVNVVISQVYGGGGNSGAQFRNDFVEIFNRGSDSVDLTGWSVQYAGATSASWSVTTLTGAMLAPGQYYLIQEGSGGASGQALPPPNVIGATNMAATAGKVALVTATTALAGTCPASSNIVDLVGYGTSASCFEGPGPTSAPANTSAVIRRTGGCSDTQNNRDDFVVSAPTPRNSASTFNPCSTAALLNKQEHHLRRWVDGSDPVYGERNKSFPRACRELSLAELLSDSIRQWLILQSFSSASVRRLLFDSS